MSQPIRATANRVATVWPIESKDIYGQITYGAPYLVTATFEQGSSREYRDAMGQKYIPASIYWYEYDSAVGVPNLNDVIALGDHLTEADPNNIEFAETIKNRIREDNSVLGDADDVMVLT